VFPIITNWIGININNTGELSSRTNWTKSTYDLNKNQYNAINNANSPSLSNVFATMNDLLTNGTGIDITGTIISISGAYINTTIQNWSADVYNLVTKRAYAYEGATVEWIDGNIGSKLTMKYPGVYLMGERAYGETLSIAFAGKGQHQDTGAKMVHLAPNTTSKVTSKSVSRLDGRSTYRGMLNVAKGATGVKSTVRCDALLLDDTSKTDTYPYMEINQEDATITHEATVGKIGDEQIFYLMTRGFSEEEALSLIVNGFMEPFTKELPMEYAVELNRLIKLEMDDSVG